MFQASLGRAEPPAVRVAVERSAVAATLIDASREAQMVVVGSRGMGALGRAVLGSVSTALVHHAHCPVSVVYAEEAQTFDRTSLVLLGVDGSPLRRPPPSWPSTKRLVGEWTLALHV